MAPPTVTAELVGRGGRLPAVTQPNAQGLVLTARVVDCAARVTACALAGSGSSKTLGVVTDTGHVYALHLAQQRRFTLLDVLPAPGTAVAFMVRLSRRMFVGCCDGSLHCFDVGSSMRVAQLPGHRTAIGSLSCRSDSEQLVSASSDAVLLWDVAAFRQRRVLGAVPHGCSQAAFSPSGALVAVTVPSNGRIALWDARGEGREAGTLHAPLGAAQRAFAFSSISISPDESMLVAGCRSPALLLVYSLSGPGRPAGLQHALQMQGGFGMQQVQVLPDSSSAAGEGGGAGQPRGHTGQRVRGEHVHVHTGRHRDCLTRCARMPPNIVAVIHACQRLHPHHRTPCPVPAPRPHSQCSPVTAGSAWWTWSVLL